MKSNQYLFPATDAMKYGDPNWLDFDADVGAWADLTFQVVPLPAPAIAGLGLLGVLGLVRAARRRRGRLPA